MLKKQSDMIAKNQAECVYGGYRIKENTETDNDFDDGPNFVYLFQKSNKHCYATSLGFTNNSKATN